MIHKKLSLLAALICFAIALQSCADGSRRKCPLGSVWMKRMQVITGKAIFQQNCATCHLKNADVSGPALQGAVERWGGDTARLKAFIRNPAKLIEDKDPEAVRVYDKYKPTVMTAFPGLSDADLNALIAYIESDQ